MYRLSPGLLNLRKLASALTLLLIAVWPASAGIVASSDFTLGMDGWSNGGHDGTVSWDNVNNLLFALDDPSHGDVMYFSAADKFLHNNVFGGTLSFDIRFHYVGGDTWLGGYSDVIVQSSVSPYYEQYAFFFPTYPAADVWQHYDVPLGFSGWYQGGEQYPGGTPATEAQMQAALASPKEIYIRGEFYLGAGDSAYLDNVVLTDAGEEGVPEPDAWLLATGGLALLALKRMRSAASAQ